jgi:ABC-2 type transport system ATP-binding protein
VLGGFRDLLSRQTKQIKAVDNISFNVEQGELLGYIGPNGAGKSTSIKMLTGILKPTSGDMNIMGFHPFRERKLYTKHIGVVFGQRTQLWWDIAVKESFRLLRSIYEVPKDEYESRLKQLKQFLELDELLDVPVRKLSLGQRIRCDLTASLLHNPKVLFLDEPTIGLDAVAKDSIRTFLRQINRELGTTIILTTHDLQEIEELSTRIMILDHGNIIYDGSLNAVRNLPGIKRKAVVDFHKEVGKECLGSLLSNDVEISNEGERRVIVRFDPQKFSPVELLKAIVSSCEVADIAIAEPNIEDVVKKIYRDGAPKTEVAVS